MGWLENRREKRKQELEKAEKEKQMREEKEQASIVRSSAENIMFALDSIRFMSRQERIEEEKMEEYRKNIDSFRTALRHAATMTLDVSKIDKQIMELVTLFQQALEKGHGQTADRICGMLAYGIQKARDEIQATTEEQAKKILENREHMLERMCLLAELSEEVESLDDKIDRLDQDYEKKKAEYADAFHRCEKTQKEFPELVFELDDCIVNQKPLSGAVLYLNTQKKEVIDLYNIINNIRRVQANMKSKQEEYQSNIRVLELQLQESSDLPVEQVSERLQAMQMDFQESIRQSQNEIDAMSGVTEQFNKLLDSIFASQAMIDRILRTDMEYEKIVKQKQKIEEGRRQALEQEQMQQAAEQNVNREQLLN